MNRLSLCAIAGAAAALVSLASGAWETAASNYEPGRVQLELAPGVTIEEIHQDYGTTTADELDPLFLVDVPPGESEWVIIGEMEHDPRIVWAEVSYLGETPEAVRMMVVGVVGGSVSQYHDQGVYYRLRLGEIHEHVDGEGAVVAIIDTGVEADHPALAGFVLPGIDFVDDDDDPSDTGNGLDDDGDQLVDEGRGHGTMVAGIAHLVAPGSEILPIRVIDDEGRGRSFDVAKGIRHARENGADVINLSLGLRSYCETIAYEIAAAAEAGVVLVAAAGNDPIEDPPFFPASDPRVHGVAALDSVDVKTSFSSFHPTVSVSAPGLGILAPFPGHEWARGDGTSFAAPFVSGQAALFRASAPFSKSQTDGLLRDATIPVDAIIGNQPWVGKLGEGRLDGVLTWNALLGTTDLSPDGGTFASGSLRAAPNPSTAATRVELLLRDAGSAAASELTRSWRVVDASGRTVTLLQPREDSRGSWSAVWSGRDRRGRAVPAGCYWVLGPAEAAPARIVRITR